MSLHKRSLLTAWLGLVAMWLIVLAPLVSQLLAAHAAHEPDAPLCSITQSADAGHAQHADVSDVFGACGYCHLLEHHLAMPPLALAGSAGGLVASAALVATLSTRHVPIGAFPSGRPRAPPFAS